MLTLRTVTIVAASCGALALGAVSSSAVVPRTSAPCPTFETLEARVDDLESAREFDGAGYQEVGKDFKMAAKGAPKELQSALKKIGKLYTSVGKTKNEGDALSAYGNGLVKYDKEFTRFRAYYEANCAGTTSGASSAGSSGSGAGTLTLGDETVELESSRCFLQEQSSAGQKILFTGQASGTNAAGEPVMLDVSRYDESSQFAGDDVSIDIGDPRAGDFTAWEGRLPTGTISRSGDTLSASGIEVRDDDLATETVSFEINC